MCEFMYQCKHLGCRIVGIIYKDEKRIIITQCNAITSLSLTLPLTSLFAALYKRGEE